MKDAGIAVLAVIENIHQKILAAINDNGNKLEMSTWHTCETTHCRGGWAIVLGGEDGKKLESETSTLFAAMQILKSSSTIPVPLHKFFENNEKAMEDIIRCAEEEKSLINK